MSTSPTCDISDTSATVLTLCMGSISFGLHMAVAGMTCYFSAKYSENFRGYYLYIGTLLVASSVNYFLVTAQFISVSHNITNPYFWPFDVLPETMAIFVNVLCNLFLMYRCYVVWNGWKPILIIPTLLLIATHLYGIIMISMHSPFAVDVTYWPFLLSLNLTLSGLICVRVLWLRWQFTRLVGEGHKLPGKPTIVSLIVESSTLYTIVVLLGGISWSFGYTPHPFSPLLVHTECIAIELIILRVVLGCSVTRHLTTTAQTAQATTEPNQ